MNAFLARVVIVSSSGRLVNEDETTNDTRISSSFNFVSFQFISVANANVSVMKKRLTVDSKMVLTSPQAIWQLRSYKYPWQIS